MANCKIHTDTKLVCPKCQGAKGGKKRTEKHGHKLSEWGAMGGRPKSKASK